MITSYKNLFEFPIQLTITGQSRSGKSYLLRNHILPTVISQYKSVIIYSPTVLLDAGWPKFKSKYSAKVTLIDDIDHRDITQFIQEIGKRKAKGNNTKFLFIFDDITTYLSPSNSSFFATLATSGRHYNISYIVVSHKYKAINPLIRNNSDKIFFKPRTVLELNSVADDITTADIDISTIKKMLAVCTSNHKSFYILRGREEDFYYCLLKGGGIKPVFSIKDIIEEYEDESKDVFTADDYKLLQTLMKNENIIFV